MRFNSLFPWTLVPLHLTSVDVMLVHPPHRILPFIPSFPSIQVQLFFVTSCPPRITYPAFICQFVNTCAALNCPRTHCMFNALQTTFLGFTVRTPVCSPCARLLALFCHLDEQFTIERRKQLNASYMKTLVYMKSSLMNTRGKQKRNHSLKFGCGGRR